MSKSANRNPYKRGNYKDAFAWMQKQGVVTRSALVKFLMGKGLKATAAAGTAAVLLSPREKDSKRGSCLGNYSARGESYFMEPLKKVTGEEKRFRLRYRKVVLARRVYKRVALEVKQEKTVKKAVKVKAKAKKAKKATAKAKVIKAPAAATAPAPAPEAAPAPAPEAAKVETTETPA